MQNISNNSLRIANAPQKYGVNSPITLRLSENTDVAYKIVGKLAGINVLFDPEVKPQRLNVELNDVTPREALGSLPALFFMCGSMPAARILGISN